MTDHGEDQEAYVTLATTDQLVLGALVLAYSLRDTKTTRKLVIMMPVDINPVMG